MTALLLRPLAAAAMLALFCHAPLTAAEEFSSLEERMTVAEFRAAGLDKLTPEELARLNDWLRARAAGATAFPGAAANVVEDRRGLHDGGASEGPIVSRVIGEFRGWSGSGERITLENGHVWETTDPGSRLSVLLNDPIITIRPGVLNAWFLSVEGYNTRVRVRRVR